MNVFAWLQRHQVALVGAALMLLGAGLAVDRAGRHDPPGIDFAYGAGVPDGSPIRVQVTGAVERPGVYELRGGDRVVDAIAAAGGPADAADLDAINLARRVRDEERVTVPELPAGSGGRDATVAPGARLDINTATQQQLDALPGIGEAYSRRIVDSRKVDGPYKTTRDLVDRKVIPAAVYEKVRDLIAVGQ
jgi:competence protein ComEA